MAATLAMGAGVAAALELARGQFVAGGGLLLVSVAVLRWPRSIWSAPAAPATSRWRIGALLAVTAIAIVFRAYRLVMPGLWGDDAINGLLALDVLDGKIASPFTLVHHAYSHFHALTNFAIAGAFRAFGANLATLRLPGVIAGALAVPLLYGAVAPLFGARVALIAALFFGTSALQVNHSKILIQVILGEFFELCGLCLLLQGLARRRVAWSAAAGVPFALSLYTYHSAKLAPAVAAIVLLAWWWREPAERRRTVQAAVAFAAVFVACGLPAVFSYAANPAALTGRIEGTALWPQIRAVHSLAPLWDAGWRTLMIFNYEQGPPYHWVGIGDDPALDLVVAFLFVHGLIESLWRWRDRRHLILLGWCAVGLVPGFLSSEAPRVYRVLLATPPLFVWAALPLVQLWDAAGGDRRTAGWARAVVVVAIAAVPLIDFNYYFYRVYTHPQFRWFQSERMLRIARRLRALGPEWTGYVASGTFSAGYESLAFLSRIWGLTLHDVTTLAEVIPARDENGVLVAMDRGSTEARLALRSFYPDAPLEVVTDPPQRTWWFDEWLPLIRTPPPASTVTFVPISAGDIAKTHGVQVIFRGAQDEPVEERLAPELRISAAEVPAGAVGVQLSAGLYAATEGTYRFEALPDCTLSIDGQPRDASDGRFSAELAQGLHPFGLRCPARAGELMVRWQPPQQTLQPIAARYLFRNGSVHGLLATYTANNLSVHRIEPYPYFAFFPPTMPGPFHLDWSGCVRMPDGAGSRIEVDTNFAHTLEIDGARVGAARIAPGTHTIRLRGDAIGALRVRFLWSLLNQPSESIPPEAFTPFASAP